MSITPRRLSPEASRELAIDAARVILVEEGPQAVTLKAVAGRIGRTHANLLHHFGTAAGLQQALAAHMAETITARIGDAVARARAGQADPRLIVDLTFDAFEVEGAGALASWMILSGDRGALSPVLGAIHRLVEELGSGAGDRPVAELTLELVLTALGQSLLGCGMADALGLPASAARELMVRRLLQATARGGDVQ